MRLSVIDQLERYGMTLKAAEALRDRVAARMTASDVNAAREAWQKLAYELRGNKGQPMQAERHPEAVRLRMLAELDAGKSIDAAVEAARAFARGHP